MSTNPNTAPPNTETQNQLTGWEGVAAMANAYKASGEQTDLAEFYEQVDDPLTTDSLKDIMKIYADGAPKIYGCLSKVNAENKNFSPNMEDEKTFRESLYADWVDSLRNMTKDDVQKRGRDFYLMGRYIMNHLDIKTRQELVNSINAEQNVSPPLKESLSDLIESECYDHASKIGWDFARNCKIKPKHRPYMNIPQDEIYKFAQLVKNGCDEVGVNYDFKLEDNEPRTDSFMMYLTDEMLTPTVKVLKEIEIRHPDIIKKMGKPPVLSGKINSWLGYGSEPEDGKNSFNEKRADIIQKVVDMHIVEYATKHGHDATSMEYNGKKLNLNQYIAIQETNEYMRILANDFKRAERRNEIQGQKKKDVKDELGYGKEHLRVGSSLYNMLLNFYARRRETDDGEAAKYLSNKNAPVSENSISNIQLSVGDTSSRIVRERRPISGKHTELGSGVENKVFRKIILGAMINDNNEIDSIRKDILSRCEENGIDPQKFCFDKYVLKD